jgi:hypothetical protein
MSGAPRGFCLRTSYQHALPATSRSCQLVGLRFQYSPSAASNGFEPLRVYEFEADAESRDSS